MVSPAARSAGTTTRPWCPRCLRVDAGLAETHMAVDAVLRVRSVMFSVPYKATRRWSRCCRTPEWARSVRCGRGIEVVAAGAPMGRHHGCRSPTASRAPGGRGPSPRCCGTTSLAAHRSSLPRRPALVTRMRACDVGGGGLGVVDVDDPVPVVVEHPGVDQFVLRLAPACAALVASRSSYGNAACG